MTITPMTMEILPQVALLERLCFSQPWSQTALEEELANPCATWLVAKDAGQLLGYAGMHQVLDEASVTNVAVDPAHRRKGVAKTLMLTLEEICRQKGASFLTLEVRASNQNAIALYRSLGFETVGQRKHYYTHPTEDALLLTKFFAGEETL
ncbi:MAG: ribosomal protein S18-alanine N-acetyltransferase [Oscillospiraceae bacterium]|jgi:ribosomal-protein-alanine N-acetyltransferase